MTIKISHFLGVSSLDFTEKVKPVPVYRDGPNARRQSVDV